MGFRCFLRVTMCTFATACMLAPAAAGAMTISGTVIDGETADPLAGVEVTAYPAADAWSDDGVYPSGYASWTATTDATGTYSIEGLASADYVVSFSDVGNTYRDLTWPQSTLPVPIAYAVPADYTNPVDAELYPFQSIIDARVERLAGSNRYRTAMEVVRSTFISAETAVLVSGEDFPDALCATPLAGVYDAPLLLTKKDSLPPGLTDLLKDLGVAKVFIVGGETVVSANIETQLRSAGFKEIERIAGASRYHTSSLVARKVCAISGMFPFLCRGDDFADALAAGPIAYQYGMPILLTKPQVLSVGPAWKEISKETGSFVIVVGGENAIQDEVLGDLEDWSWSDDYRFTRFAGADRYDTASQLADALVPYRDIYGLATGKDFPDALAGGAAIGRWRGVLLLTKPESLSRVTGNHLYSARADISWLEVLGGPMAINDTVMDQAYLKLGNAFRDFDQEKIVSRGTLAKAPFTTSLNACDIGVSEVGVYATSHVVVLATPAGDVAPDFDISSLDWSVYR